MSMKFELERMKRIADDVEKLRCPIQQEIKHYRMKDGDISDGHCCSTVDWEDFSIDTPWTELDSHRCFRTTITIPEEMAGKHVEFRVTTGREGQWDATNPQMLFYLDGKIIQGVDVNHREITISKQAEAGKSYEVALKAYSGSEKGDLILKTHLITVDDKVEKLHYDFTIPLQSAKIMLRSDPENSRRILEKLGKAADVLDLRKPYSSNFYQSLDDAEAILKEEFYSKIDESAPLVSAIGHTHIDIAWLWTVQQTREKVLRSFSTVLRLMEQYPEYKFMSSQPILYQFVKEQEPELYEKIKARIAEGRWEVDGAMWLESDCNLPCGESFVRQIIKGHRFFLDEFGIESKSLWLPDVFGYSAALPQILKKSGIPYFMTTKIAWNQYNQLPNDTFMWKGLDGSEVFVFMPTTCDFDKNQGLNISFTDTRNTTTYTGIVNPNMTMGTFKRFQNKDLTEDTLMLFGFGDGGGGPTKEMLENAERLKYGLPGMPRIKQEFEREFFDRTYGEIAHKPQMPTWSGELYFEYHRGTYTSMAKNKRNNRKSELLYESLETLGSVATLLGGKYPKDTIDKGWDIILLNQFHDIIPGSSIEAVYEQTDIEYAEILSEGEKALKKVAKEIASRMERKKDRQSITVFNTLGYMRDDIVEVKDLTIPVSSISDEQGNNYDVQYISEDTLIFFAKGIPSFGCKVFYLNEGDKPENSLKKWTGDFENSYYSAKFNDKMELTSLYEKESDKEFLKPGRVGNKITAYEDRPMNWDNWDIDIFYKKKSYNEDWISEPEVIETGNLRTTLRVTRKFMDSTVTQDIHLYRDLPRIDFETKADWKEHNVLLKANFPVDVNTTKASFEIQFGNVERETTSNQSWDTAKFETCGHKWADLSEEGLGISLLNDCKYGHSIKNGEMELTLLKAGTYPNENADIGKHEFIYSIYPHSGRWQEAHTVEMAYNLNVPALVVSEVEETAPTLGTEWSMVSSSHKNCVIEVLKQAEDKNGLILRMYENQNRRTKATIQLAQQPKQIFECDLLENNESEFVGNRDSFTAVFKPYEIKTFRLVF